MAIPRLHLFQLPRHFDQLGLTDAQRAEVLRLTVEHREKKAKLEEALGKLAADRKDERATSGRKSGGWTRTWPASGSPS